MGKRTNRGAWRAVIVLTLMALAAVAYLLIEIPIGKTEAILIAKLAMAIKERPGVAVDWTAQRDGKDWLVGANRVAGYGPDGKPQFSSDSGRCIQVNRYGLVVGYSGSY